VTGKANPNDPHERPALPREDDGPVFAEPWQARAFALAVELRDAGLFDWSQWSALLGEEILRAQSEGDPLRTLERLVQEKGLVSGESLTARADAWREAARNTPHGEPIRLEAAAKDIDRGPR
jgi:nitrile hydratase accessory protein